MLEFVRLTARAAFRGSASYYQWLAFLLIWVVLGAVAYGYQLRTGLVVTHLTDQVSWGAYIANFTFLVGLAAAAAVLLIPAHLYGHRPLASVVVFGELMAVVAVLMCGLFLLVDLGHPERFWHLIPMLGVLHWPTSLLSWDLLVLAGYLVLNLVLALHLLHAHFHGREPRARWRRPLVWLTIVWAISIHTVTAFLYSGLGGRPYWHAAIVAPHFLASAFASGAALMMGAFWLVRRQLGFPVEDAALDRLRQIASVSLWINLFLFGAELFTALYAGGAHGASLRYRLFGLEQHGALVGYTWAGIALTVAAAVVLSSARLHQRAWLMLGACGAAVIGVWIEKGMGLVVPGFVPTPLGEVVDYAPSFAEFCISAGIWAFGALLYTLMLKAAVPVALGQLRAASVPRPATS